MNEKQYGGLQQFSDVYEAILVTSEKQGLIKDIPIFGYFYKAAIATNSVSDQLFMLKLSRFIGDTNKISNQELTSIKTALLHEPNDELAEKIVLTVDSLTESDKSRYIAQALHLYSMVELTKNDFLRSLDLIQKMYIGDLKIFASVRSIWFCTSEELEHMDLVSLIGTPILKVQYINQDELRKDGRTDEIGLTKFEETNFGRIFRDVLNNRPPYSELQKQDKLTQKELYPFG